MAEDPTARRYHLPLETGATTGDDGASVAWAASPALPGAYAEAATSGAARAALADLSRRIIAEHLLRDDPLDPDIAITDHTGADRGGVDILVVAVGAADVEEARSTPLLVIEQPEP
jgi:hypothetical protein